MRIANILIVYKDPKLIERIIRAMSHKSFDFYVHVDKKFDETPFRKQLQNIPGVYFVKKRFSVKWGGFSIVEAHISCIGEILSSGREYQFFNNLSGQDYPIKPANYIFDFFQKNIGKSFIESEKYPTEWWKKAEARFSRYHLTDFNLVGRPKLEDLLVFLLPKRKFPLPYTLYGGPYGTFWTLSLDAVKYFHHFMVSNKKLQRFFKFTWAADEFLLNTILMNSPLKNTIINNNYRYIDWSNGGASPKIITETDFNSIKKSDKLFARKFDLQIDSKILKLIDDEILSQKYVLPTMIN